MIRALVLPLLALVSLAACHPPLSGGVDTAAGGPATTASGPPFSWPDDYRDAAVVACLGDGAPPALGASTSGGDLASCQAIVAGRYGRGAPR